MMALPSGTENGNATPLVMRIPLSAHLNATLAEVRKAIANNPNFSLVFYGTEVSYLARRESEGEFYMFRFGADYVVAEVFSKTSPVYLMRESLLALLGVLSFLNGIYEVDASSIFPYLISVLALPELSLLYRDVPGKRQEKMSDILLSKRIVQLHAELEALSSESKRLRERFALLLSHLAIKESATGRVSLSLLAETYNAERSEIDRMVALLPTIGYRVIRHDGDKVSLVRN